MKSHRWAAAGLCAIALTLGGLPSAQQLPSEPPKQFGASITGAFEGWFDNPDGSHNFLVGYLNRNRAQEIDVPIGPSNRIEPGGPDMGQPAHFLPGRQTGMFIVTVPKAFTPQQQLTWTITVNGQTNSIPLRLHPDYNIDPFSHAAVNNTAPVLRFEENGPTIQGPIGTVAKAISRTTSVGAALPLSVWAADDAKFTSLSSAPMRNPPQPVSLRWSKYRGPGAVTFDKARPQLEVLAGGSVNVPFSGKATTTARFSEPGDYVLHLVGNDYSGDGGGAELCCWTTATVKVSVTR